MDLSIIVLNIYIALMVPFPATNPHCSCAISGPLMVLVLFSTILSKIFVIWLIKLIVLCSWHSIAPAFLEEQ